MHTQRDTHTQWTDCFTWTTKVVSKNLLWPSWKVRFSAIWADQKQSRLN